VSDVPASDLSLADPMADARLLVDARGLGKRYPIVGQRGDRVHALWDIVRGRAPRRTVGVLEDVGFEVRRGESLGIIGENGAGKSTLLKLVTGVLTPSAGSVRTHGRIGALLELGAGFHPEYTGMDNVRMAAALHGLAGEELAAKLPEIRAFADIGAYIDEPVKHYSSGMVVRLGFAVTAALRPDLLITDEVLAVGDESFQRKCIRWIDDYLAGGGTLLLVSHNLYHVQKLCRRALWLDGGRTRELGDVFDVTQAYLAWHERKTARAEESEMLETSGEFALADATINGERGEAAVMLSQDAPLLIEAVLDSADGRPPVLSVGITRAEGSPVYGISSDMESIVPQALGGNRFRYRLAFAALPLLPGEYHVKLHPLDPEGMRLFGTLVRRLIVRGASRELGMVRLRHRWLDVDDVP
jgi:lipopolysaccharide transport system ATP-binding protein